MKNVRTFAGKFTTNKVITIKSKRNDQSRNRSNHC